MVDGDGAGPTDDELIRDIQRAKRADRQRFDELFAELVRRHEAFLLAATRRLRMGADRSHEDLVQETLLRFSSRVEAYETEDLDRDRSRRRLRAYLGKVALRIWIRWWRDAGGPDGVASGARTPDADPPASSQDVVTRQDDDEATQCPAEVLVCEALAGLNERDRDLLDDYRYYDPDLRCIAIPPQILHELLPRRRYRTPNAMAQARLRALERLRKRLEELGYEGTSGQVAA